MRKRMVSDLDHGNFSGDTLKPNLQEAMEKAVVACYVDAMSRKQLERKAYMQHLQEQHDAGTVVQPAGCSTSQDICDDKEPAH